DHESIASYLKDGILNGGKTFIRGVRNFSPGETIEYIDRELTIKNSSRSFSGFEEKNPAEVTQQIKDILSDSLQKWISKYSIHGANLTGGADTRLLLALLEKNQRQDFQFFTDRSPHLNEDEDRDVIIAKELAKRFGLNHEVRIHPTVEITDDKSFLRSEPADVLKLSGNHGGEILGGDVFGAMEFCKATHWREDFTEDYQSLCSLMFRAFFSDIYDGGVFNHWTMPFKFSGRKCAPFWDQRLIHLLSQQDKNNVYHYGLYAELYRKHFPEFIKTPFLSPIATHHKDFIMMKKGQNQKLVAKKKATTDLLNKEKESILKVGFFDYHELKNKSETSIKRALKVNRWIDFFIKEKKWSSL
ncbi:MAG: hypothetical protein NXH75_14985, partial [Halobacteriovoraceae bacterium]|nr:hypothetical protein [Halobacteriovoraceae bacterium]